MASTLTPAQLAVAKQIVGYLNAAYPSNSSIAFAGNAAQESSFNPLASGDGGVSNGLWQWGGNRFANLKSWCLANGLDWRTVEGQSKFLIHELPTPDGAPAIVSWITDRSNNGQPARPLATLVADVVQYFERAGTPALDNRIAYANQIAAFLGSSPVVAPVPVPVVTPPQAVIPAAPSPGASPIMNPEIIAILAQLLAPTIEGIISGLIKGLSATSVPAIAMASAPAPLTAMVDPAAIASALLPQLSALAAPAVDVGSLVTQIVEGLAAKQAAVPPTGAKP